MIPFFRKTRKKMADNNKPIKYVRYAIGEIVLVVIGILIALQINNWNEERKRELLAQTYIEKLINDLVLDTININEKVKLGQISIKNVDIYFEYFNEGTHSLDELIDSSLLVNFSYFRYLPVNYTFKDMQSSGNTDLLNESQRRAMMELSNEQEYTLIIIEKTISNIFSEQREYQKYLNPLFYDKVSIKQDDKSKMQGLLHRNNTLDWGRSLGGSIEWRANIIKKKTKETIVLLQEN